jgi:hypothetical protein
VLVEVDVLMAHRGRGAAPLGKATQCSEKGSVTIEQSVMSAGHVFSISPHSHGVKSTGAFAWGGEVHDHRARVICCEHVVQRGWLEGRIAVIVDK